MHFEAFQKLSESEFPRPPGRLYLGVPETIGMHQWRLTVPDITDGVGERGATPQGWAGGHLSWRPARNWWQHVDLDPRHAHGHTQTHTRTHTTTPVNTGANGRDSGMPLAERGVLGDWLHSTHSTVCRRPRSCQLLRMQARAGRACEVAGTRGQCAEAAQSRTPSFGGKNT